MTRKATKVPVIAAILFCFAQAAGGAIMTTGQVDPPDPASWTGATFGIIGKTLDVVIEKQARPVSGLTDNYIRVFISGSGRAKKIRVLINRVAGDATYGAAVDD